MSRSRIRLAMVIAIVLAALPLTAQTFTTADAAVPIPDNSGGVITACQDIVVVGGQNPITDLNVEVTAAHTWVGDVTVVLTHDPAGTPTSLTLLNRPGRTGAGTGNSDDLQDATPIQYNDEAASAVSAEDMGGACGGLIDGSAGCEDNYTPAPDTADTPNAGLGTDLTDFNGLDGNATWRLCMADSGGGDTGTLTSWSLGFGTLPVELQSFDIE